MNNKKIKEEHNIPSTYELIHKHIKMFQQFFYTDVPNLESFMLLIKIINLSSYFPHLYFNCILSELMDFLENVHNQMSLKNLINNEEGMNHTILLEDLFLDTDKNPNKLNLVNQIVYAIFILIHFLLVSNTKASKKYLKKYQNRIVKFLLDFYLEFDLELFCNALGFGSAFDFFNLRFCNFSK